MIRVAAHAKVNLYLHVIGRRADGRHLLDSLVVFADLDDSVAVEPADEMTLAIDGPFAASLAEEPDNLVLRAARALALAHRRAPKAHLRLTKRIPVAAGLGGGSADAAAALRALSELWSVSIPDELAISLGADVPACLFGRPLRMSGAGEILAPAPTLPPAFLLLVNPGIAVSTREVFLARSGAFSEASPIDSTPTDARDLADHLGRRRNDLTAAARAIAPAIAEAEALVAATDGCLLARMSGSGGTVFGVYETAATAAAADVAIRRARPSWWSWSGAMRP